MAEISFHSSIPNAEDAAVDSSLRIDGEFLLGGSWQFKAFALACLH
jgi:hypothetical protein